MKYRIDIIHARGHVPSAMALLAKTVGLVKVIFDIRGFMPEEYVDAGLWPAGGGLYRITKAVEYRLLASADGFVVLTKRAREILFPGCSVSDGLGRPIEVIPCCVDMKKFKEIAPSQRDSLRRSLRLSDRRVLVYVGALGGWYLSSNMAEFIAIAQEVDPSILALMLTQSHTQAELFKSRLRQLGVSTNDCRVSEASPTEVPEYLAAADFGFCFIKPGYSKKASSPTKIGEFLASGLPVLCNTGIGDSEEILVKNRVGVLIGTFDRESYISGLRELAQLASENGIRQRCRSVAQQEFDLGTIGRTRYHRLYMRTAERGPTRALGERPGQTPS